MESFLQKLRKTGGAEAGADPVNDNPAPAAAPVAATPVAAAPAAASVAAEVVVPPSTRRSPPPQSLSKPWTVQFSGRDCEGRWSCTRPAGHTGHHNGICVPGQKCSTIYPHNRNETHAWLSISITLTDGTVIVVPPVDLTRRRFDGLPIAGHKFLRQVASFIFGNGSAMSRLWLASVNSAATIGPRTRIVDTLNQCLTHPTLSPCDALAAVAENCARLPWPPPGYE